MHFDVWPLLLCGKRSRGFRVIYDFIICDVCFSQLFLKHEHVLTAKWQLWTDMTLEKSWVLPQLTPHPIPSFISGIASLGAHPELYLMCSESEDKTIHSWPSTRSAGQIHYRTGLCSHSHKKHKLLLKNNILSYNLYTEWLKSTLTLEITVMQRMSSDFCAMLCYSLYLSRCWKLTKI
jgi:hypothetical protein